MATLYVSKLGSDSNDGSSAANAFLTIDHACNQLSAGDTVIIAPGTYRELVTIDQDGAIDYSPPSPIDEAHDHTEFFGDTEAKNFPNVSPGVIRVTQATAGTEAAGSSNNYIWDFNAKKRIRVHNIIADGLAGSTNNSAVNRYAWRNSSVQSGVACFNCTGIASYASFHNVAGIVRCLGVGGYINISSVECHDSVGIGGLYVYRGTNGYYKNCISMGGLYGFIPTGDAIALNCMSLSYRGFLFPTTDSLIENCITLGSYNAYWSFSSNSTSAVRNSIAIAAAVAFNNQFLENCYVSNSRQAYSSANNDGPGGTAQISEAPAISWSLKNMRMMQEAFQPFMARGLMNQGTYSNLTGAFGANSSVFANHGPSSDPGLPSGSAPILTDCLGRNRVNAAYDIATAKNDIGPYEFTVFSGSMSSADYNTNAPGINIQGRGEVVFEVAVPSGSSITASVFAKTPDASYPPRFLLRDPHTYYLYDTVEKKRNSRNGIDVTASSVDVGSSWSNNTFQELTVHAPNTTYDRMYELVVSGAAGANVTSSFSDFNVIITGSG